MPKSVPNYLTVDPVTGGVGANFTGLVHALGLYLDAAKDGPFIPQNFLRWIHPDHPNDQTGVNDWVRIVGRVPDLGLIPGLDLQALNPTAGVDALLRLNVTAAFQEVRARANNSQARIIGSDGSSDFAQHVNIGGLSGQVGVNFNPYSSNLFTLGKAAPNGLLFFGEVTGFVNTAGVNTNIQLLVDGSLVAQQWYYFNNAGVHMTLPVMAGRSGALAAGNHTIQCSNPSSPLAADSFDSGFVAWIG